MFYGSLKSNNTSEEFYSQKIDSMARVLEKSNCISEKHSYRNFFANLYLSPQLKSKNEEFVFFGKDHHLLILVDGFIFNKKEIKKELGITYSVNNKAFIVYLAYLKWGFKFVEFFNGDFIICIYQTDKDQILFFRDHLGLRPLVFSNIDSTFFFSTNPREFSKALFQNEPIDNEFLLNFFLQGGYRNDLLPKKKIHFLKPGHYLRFSFENNEMNAYWEPKKIKTDNSLQFSEITKNLIELLEDSVKIRSDHRFQASAHVSGGIDSGIVAALSRKEFGHQKNYFGFSWTPSRLEEKASILFDERILVNAFCKKNNIIPVFTNFSIGDYHSFISNWKAPSEQLFEGRVIERATQNGINLIFSGWGGDEFISIGHRGIDADLIREGHWLFFLRKHPIWRPKKFLSALFNALFPGARRGYSKIKAEPSVYPYIKKALGSNRIPRKERFKYHSRRLVHLQLLELGHLAKRASDWYVKGQLNGIEYRYPLLDKRIVEYMLKVPSRCLVGGNHYRILLREIGKDIFTPEMLENKSKDDPVKSHYFSEIIKKVEQDFINEFETFRNNPDLSFVDFDLLEKNLPKIRAGKMDASIFYYLKAAHEFTKGYYGKD